VEGVGHQHTVDGTGQTLCDVKRIGKDPLPDRSTLALDFFPRLLDHHRVEIERMDLAVDQRRQWCREVAVAAAQVEHRHFRLDPQRSQHPFRIGPQRGPPITVGH
jgi:hypothetical protein